MGFGVLNYERHLMQKQHKAEVELGHVTPIFMLISILGHYNFHGKIKMVSFPWKMGGGLVGSQNFVGSLSH